MPLIIPANTLSGDYDVSNSLRFGGDNHHLSMVYGSSASTANRRTWTFSGWIKLGQAAHYSLAYANDKYLLSSTDAAVSTTHIGYGYTAGDFFLGDGRSATYIYTTSKFRDPSAWYHLVVKYDSTQGTVSDRIFIYVNGVSQGLAYSNSGDPEVDLNTAVDFFLAGDDVDATSADSGNFVHNVNSYYNSGYGSANNEFDGYIADFYLLDGQALAPTAFAETNDNGIWVPKKYTGTFNSHSFHLEFKQTGSSANSSGMGADTSGQDNHFKVGVNSTLAATDVTTDTPTNNFATFNPLVVRGGSDDLVYSEGNTSVSSNQHATNNYTFGTQGFANGKWYWEVECETVGGEMHIGIVDSGSSTTGYPSIYREYRNNGNKDTNTGSASSFGNTYTDGDIIGVAVDLDNTSIYYSKNGTWQNSGNPESGASKTGAAFTDISSTNFSNFVLPWVAGAGVNGGADLKAFANFGNPPFSISSGNADANGYGNFEYAVPSGYFALCTKNLAEYG
jgi:hypothetical protein